MIGDYPTQLDKIDQWLYDNFGILPGACSSTENLRYSVARRVAEALWPKTQILPSDVDEAAEKFVYDWAGLSPTERRIAERAYLAGAEWQKEQMMEEWLKDRDGCFWDGVEEGKKVMEEQMLKDAVDARVYYRDSVPGGEFIEIVADILNPTGVRYKDKVKIVIVKEDKE